MGNNATSTPPKRSPTSANAGHTGTLSSSSPSRTVRYPVSPAKYSFLCVWRSSTTHAAQSACHLSNPVRPETCCEGVQDSRTSAFTAGPQHWKGEKHARDAHPTSPARGLVKVVCSVCWRGMPRRSALRICGQRMKGWQEGRGESVYRCWSKRQISWRQIDRREGMYALVVMIMLIIEAI
jgi:hypothetical protein